MKVTLKSTPEKIEALREKASKEGLSMSPGNSGTFRGPGVFGKFQITGDGTVEIEITDKPWAIPEFVIRKKLEDLLR